MRWRGTIVPSVHMLEVVEGTPASTDDSQVDTSKSRIEHIGCGVAATMASNVGDHLLKYRQDVKANESDGPTVQYSANIPSRPSSKQVSWWQHRYATQRPTIVAAMDK